MKEDRHSTTEAQQACPPQHRRKYAVVTSEYDGEEALWYVHTSAFARFCETYPDARWITTNHGLSLRGTGVKVWKATKDLPLGES